MAKGFESSAPEAPRQGQNVPVLGYTDNENQGVSVVLAPCSYCSAAVEEGVNMDAHVGWHAAQEGSGPKK